MNATKFWICDNCRKKIKDINEGWVEWLELKNENGLYNSYQGIRIVHSARCNYNQDLVYKKFSAIVGDMDLQSFSGADGLMDLLLFVSEGYFDNKEELLEIIKRIHIPGYEEARSSFEEAIEEGVFEPNTKPGYYTQSNISSVLNYLKKKQ
ncbi:hypothetical protein E4K67_11895 [Desulfosporosinus fructosivorans]|uniref:Uncharacterized protein n=1 Tax=Desulfosporosinus fructosivorans TaxID=2018669 RepID=A0A4Z0R6E8_9FIRM|nr:hypothetical protein [Desulfosporosinus fructosivorans]TGE38612.1 hypothetical protein E4K67_11895 [Desulfosporosinus fructosivorans]